MRVANTVAACGRSMPNDLNSEFEALGEPEADEQADDRGEQPDHEPLEQHRAQHLARVAPIVRSVANSRVRCAIVIESVLAITNAPDEERDARRRRAGSSG